MNLEHPKIITFGILALILVLALSLTWHLDIEVPEGITFPVEGSGFEFPYHLDRAYQSLHLPGDLTEISGLAWADDDLVLAIQDEKGIIYAYDLNQEAISQKVRFGKNHDYEGITKVGKEVYVLKSDGDIFKIDSLSGEKVDSKKYETPLSQNQDTEGIAYDPFDDQLLIALKQDKKGDKRLIYGFNLADHKLSKDPVYTIDQSKLGKLLYKKKKDYKLRPSGIAVHPQSGHLYVIASVGKILVVLDRNSKLLYAERLLPKDFPQPEGIAFAPDGTLYLSSEGRSGQGRLLVFKPEVREE